MPSSEQSIRDLLVPRSPIGWLVFLALFALGVAAAYELTGDLLLRLSKRTWIETEGAITFIDSIEYRDSARIRYRFSINGEVIEGQRIGPRLSTRMALTAREYSELREALDHQRTVPVRVNPDNFAESFVDIRPSEGYFVSLALAPIVTLGFLYVYVAISSLSTQLRQRR